MRTFRPKLEKKKKNPPEKFFFIFQEMELSCSNIKKALMFSYISGNRNFKKASNISGKGTFQPKLEKISYTSGNGTLLYFRKRSFLIFCEKYIQNPDIFRTRCIFKTLVYLEPEAYLEHCQTSTMELFA